MKHPALVFALVVQIEAALRFGCSTLTIQRLDPVVEPGKVPSAHLHQIVGGNAFNASMVGDVGERGTCTTCIFTEDLSNYWTATYVFLLLGRFGTRRANSYSQQNVLQAP